MGTVHINNKTQRGPDNFPFLGVKGSGVGVQGIKYSIEAMTNVKSIVFDVKWNVKSGNCFPGFVFYIKTMLYLDKIRTLWYDSNQKEEVFTNYLSFLDL